MPNRGGFHAVFGQFSQDVTVLAHNSLRSFHLGGEVLVVRSQVDACC
ncbi:MAG TPA: hypothetical protein VNU92_00905 [Edaphobacter sp.]|nr:hypothetical protein [Edaphobacter sp.]